jgi:hypothetical protein
MMNFDTRIGPALLAEHDGMNDADAALFRRKWEVRDRVLDAYRMLTLCSSIISRIAKLASIRPRLET